MTETVPAVGDVEEIDPSVFDRDGNHLFSYSTGDTGSGTCLFNGGPEASVTCTGTAPDDAPDVEVPPFDRQRPGATTIDTDGVTYSIFEGVPPAPASLDPGQRVSFDAEGSGSCEMGEDVVLDCAVGGSTLTISGDDSTIEVDAELQDSENHVSDSPGGIDGDYTEDDTPVSAGTMCGAASGNTLVQVREGSVSCPEAQRIIDDYRDRRESEGGGNTLAVTVDGWLCSSPTAVRSAELDAGEVCDSPDGVRITTPPGSVN